MECAIVIMEERRKRNDFFMGMFDYVVLEEGIIEDIELGDLCDIEFQTKDFGCSLSTYVLKEDGIYKREYEYEDIDPEVPYDKDTIKIILDEMQKLVKVNTSKPFLIYANTDKGWREYLVQYKGRYIIKDVSEKKWKDRQVAWKNILEELDGKSGHTGK